ncbi:N-acetyllactosaminide beta-1,3-N-acetylglucosaminyltransferase 3 isoform X1 [Lepisosteus oculatus]|uniref:N-acetyllactosaminide beta-1,3-N-acetylglucosaminyltransferase 3 isoform X1 n=2 Tax=Lepisosteus oculatus TaxID=7918 RepID=UPI00371F95FF
MHDAFNLTPLLKRICYVHTGAEMRRSAHVVETCLLLVVGTLCMVLLFQRGDSGRDLHIRRQDSPIAVREPPVTKGQGQLQWKTVAKCKENTSMANISGFSSLPPHIKDFLRYRHCRNFPVLLDVPEKCGKTPQDSSDVFLLLMIKSSPANYDRREVIRKTWGRERRENGVWVRRVFVSGTAGQGRERRKLNRLLQLENQEYQDVLQWDFHDSFYNLTLKQILFLQWMQERCPQVHFLLNGDDDIFANTGNMVQFLQGSGSSAGDKHLFVGHLIRYVGPIREPGSKYYVPVQVQESDSYPPYCGGGGFLLSGYTARTIYNMSHSITFLPIDDVYMGMCLQKAGLEPISHIGVRTAGLHIPSQNVDPYDPCFYREILLVHRFLPFEILVMWQGINEPGLKCGISATVNSML